MARHRKNNAEDQDESFFVTMTDIMIGLLFIFLIIIVYFAYKINKEKRATENYAQTAQIHGTTILTKIKDILKEKGIEVQIDKKQGILRLPDGVLFQSGMSKIPTYSDAYNAALEVSDAFYKVLECSVLIKPEKVFYKDKYLNIKKENCIVKNIDGVFVDSIFIEGHTDNEPFREGNLTLSAQRAASTYELMTSYRKLKNYHSPNKTEIFGVSAFGETRPIKPNNTSEDKKANRRIDIRLIMYVPASKETLDTFKERLCNEFKYTKYCN